MLNNHKLARHIADASTVKPTLSLADRIFTCDACGLVIDRHLNAALNLKQYVDLEWPGDTKTGRGTDQRDRRLATVGCEQ